MQVQRHRIPGTEGYAECAGDLVARYESVSFDEKFASILELVPAAPSRVLDLGAGTGADAAWFAARGQEVVAVEPTDELREAGMGLHTSSRIRWIRDSLPDLACFTGCAGLFDIVLLSAVWMHLDLSERETAMPKLASLLAPKGRLIMSLRHGPTPSGRRMFDVSAKETILLACRCALRTIAKTFSESVQPGNRGAGVTWTVLAFGFESHQPPATPALRPG